MNKKTKCYSVRLQSLLSISEKAYKAIAFNGSEAIIPKSQVFGPDFDVLKSEAYWISAWILEQKSIQYSSKKVGWYNPAKRRVEIGDTVVERHVPKAIEPTEISVDATLTR